MTQNKLKQYLDLFLILIVVLIGDLALIAYGDGGHHWIPFFGLMLIFGGILSAPAQINLIIFDKYFELPDFPHASKESYKEFRESSSIFQLVYLISLICMIIIQIIFFLWLLEQDSIGNISQFIR